MTKSAIDESTNLFIRRMFVPPPPTFVGTRRMLSAAIETDLGTRILCLPGAKLEQDANGHPYRFVASLSACNYRDALKMVDVISGPEFFDKRATLIGLSDDGYEVRAVLEGCVFNHAATDDRVDFHFLVREFEAWFVWHTLPQRTMWRIALANYHVRLGDDFSHYSAPQDSNMVSGRIRDRISFTAFDRLWTLRDPSIADRLGQRHDLAPEPRIRGWLDTSSALGEQRGSILELAGHICTSLSLACGQSVYWTEIQELTASGDLLSRWSIIRPKVPYVGIGFSPLDNGTGQKLKPFLEAACPLIRKDEEWWARSISWFAESRHTSIAELKAAFLSILLDRISTRANHKNKVYEIDAELVKQINDPMWRQDLSAVLQRLSASWSDNRTDALISTIKQWNTKPSYAVGIRRAFDAARLPKPSRKMLSKRHKLLHLGEFDANAESILDICKTLDWLAATVLFAMLNYRGEIWHEQFGGVVSIDKPS